MGRIITRGCYWSASLSCLLLLFCFSASGQIQVNPSGLNVSTQTPTAAFLTFGNLNNQVPAEATWCGELIPATPDIGMKCNPATIFGVIPARYNRTTLTAGGGYTDIMSLPASVARRAYQAAAGGASSSFFFVRRFVSTVGGPDEFVVVTCRMTGGMTGSPLSLTSVEVGFSGVDKPILFAGEGRKLPPIKADISYTGSGRLIGRWEVVMPGDEPPEARDLLTEATLPVEQRKTQRRYTQLSRFNVFLSPANKYVLAGPDPANLPVSVAGEYLVLLRIEASDDSAARSDLAAVGVGPGVVSSGAVAAVPMPVLRYFVGPGNSLTNAVTLLTPAERRVFKDGDVLEFTWMEIPKASLYKIELGSTDGRTILSALLLPGTGFYRAPSWLRESARTSELRWRILAFGESGEMVAESGWRAFSVGG